MASPFDPKHLRRLVAIPLILLAALTFPPFWAWLAETLWGVVLLYLWTRPGARSVALMVAMAVALFLAHRLLDATGQGGEYDPVSRAGFFVGWASLLVLAWSSPSPAFTAGAVLPALVVARWAGLHLFHLYSGPTADGRMFLLDHALGDPAYMLGQWLAPYPHLRATLWVGYMALPLSLPLAYGAARQPLTRRRLLWSWVFAGAFCAPLYKVFPVVGPAFAFAGWPAVPLGVTGAPTHVRDYWERAGMPSMHLVWAILAWGFAPRAPRWVRPVLAAFVLITVVSTLGLGEHFLVDLLAAVPYAMAVAWIVTRTVRPP